MNTTAIGFIGLGKMGIPMVHNLIKSGHPVTVYNRNIAKADVLVAQGAKIAATPVDLLEQCEIVVLMVSDDVAISEIFDGEHGLLAAKAEGKIIINMSTVSPRISKEMAVLSEQKGNFYLDAPVSGSVKQAEDGSLVIMVGGNINAFNQAKPIFNCLGKLALWVGESGAGNSAKLAINTLLSFHAQGLAEAVVFAQKQGIASQDLLELINNSALGNVFMKIKGEAILQNNFNAAFALKHIAKDLRLAKAAGINSPLANAAYESFDRAEGDLGEEDLISIIKKIN